MTRNLQAPSWVFNDHIPLEVRSLALQLWVNEFKEENFSFPADEFKVALIFGMIASFGGFIGLGDNLVPSSVCLIIFLGLCFCAFDVYQQKKAIISPYDEDSPQERLNSLGYSYVGGEIKENPLHAD